MKLRPVAFLLLLLYLLLAACTTVKDRISTIQHVPLEDLLNLLPAENAIMADLIFSKISDHSQEALEQIILLMVTGTAEQRIQAEYALTGLAGYVSSQGRQKQREQFVADIFKVLKNDLPEDVSIFLLNQLQICADTKSIGFISRYLDDDKLIDTALQVMLTLGGEAAGEALVKALPEATEQNKIKLIYSLAELGYKPAAKIVMSQLKKDNQTLNQMIFYALSRMAYLPAEPFLKAAAEKDDLFFQLYLDYAKNLVKDGMQDRCLVICKEIIENRDGNFSPNQRKAALTILIDEGGVEASDILFSVLEDSDKKIRLHALHLIEQNGTAHLTPRLIDLAAKSSDEVKTEIIELLGKQKTTEAISFIRENLDSESVQVRLAALQALVQNLKDQATADLLQILKRTNHDPEITLLKRMILSQLSPGSLDSFLEVFSEFSTASKQMIIQILTESQHREAASRLINELSRGEEALFPELIEYFRLLGQDEDLTPLIAFLLRSDHDKVREMTGHAIASIVKRSISAKNSVNVVMESYQNADSENKILLLPVLKNIGGMKCLSLLLTDLKSGPKVLQDELQRVIFNWPDESALATLIQIAGKDQNTNRRILAIRGALRIIRNEEMPPQRAYLYYDRLLQLADRPQEKRQILAELAKTKTPSSLRSVAHQFNDPTTNYEAFLAALHLSQKGEQEKESLSAEEIAIALIESGANSSLLERIQKYRQENKKFNIPPEGFTALFNGIDLNGWKGLVENPPKRGQMNKEELKRAQIAADQVMNEHWQVIDGILFFDGQGFNHICTEQDYSDFELLVDWKIERAGDSGIYLRGSPQVQIWDAAQRGIGSGGLFNNQNHPSEPLFIADRSIGEWNTFRIIMRGQKVTVYLNNNLVADQVIMENYWERDKPIYPAGQIELQAHDSPLYFRNIFIRELEPEKEPFSGDLFNGRDLSGWQVIGNDEDSWKIQEGILYTEGDGGGWISTIQEFGDFRLDLEFRVPQGGNSGVFIRAPHQGDPAYTGMEIQVLDDYSAKYKNLKSWQYTGSIYGLQEPSQRVTKKAGEWQKMEIICLGSIVKVKLNNIQIIDVNLIKFMDQEKEHPGIKRRKGYIGLQNHSTRIEYRNIRLTELK